jgi:hypothetical protein
MQCAYVISDIKITVFFNLICYLVDVYWSFRVMCFVVIEDYLKMEAVCSSEIPVNIYRTAQNYFSKDSNLHSHCHENLRSYLLEIVL